MKTFILAILLSFFSFIGISQSFIGPTIGVDFAQIREFKKYYSYYVPGRNFDYFEVSENGYSASSILWGLKGEQKIANALSLCVFINYTHKRVKADIGELYFPIEELKFNVFQGSLSLKWYPKKRWHIGTGLLMNYIPHVKILFKDGSDLGIVLMENRKGYGAIFSTGYEFKNFLLEMYFNKGISLNFEEDRPEDFKAINSLGISLSYLLRVSKKKN